MTMEFKEQSITRDFRKELWTPFLTAIREYKLISSGDHIAVCISGGKDSMLLAKMMQILQRHSDTAFQLSFLAMDPGYSPQNRERLLENAKLLQIPLVTFQTDIFSGISQEGLRSPCYTCAKMRRGHLYKHAQTLGCNKIALGHHFDDVIETTVLAMFYGSQLQGMIPKLHSTNFPGMELIRPLYCVREQDIIAWRDANHLSFLDCACAVARKNQESQDGSKRQEIKQLIQNIHKTHPAVEKCIFRSIHNVHLDTFPGYRTRGTDHSFLENYRPPSET